MSLGEAATRVKFNLRESAHRTHWTEYAVRFLFGGAVTAIVGIIGKLYGPAIAGLFLAFPAILPASVTLIEKHEISTKRRAGFLGANRGRAVASVYVAGTAMGSLGLLVFAMLTWKLMPIEPAWAVIASASAAWFATSFAVWRLRKHLRLQRRHH
jgi:hypothetical protein